MTWLGADELDLLVLGSGVAGLSAAVRAADELALRVGVLTKSELSQAATRWAQGGVAAVLSGDPDSTDLHLADTLGAGADLCDVDAVRALVDEGPSRVNELIAMGAMFDRDREGQLQLAGEGGHSLPRIVHAGGAATGAEIERALVDEVRETAVACWEQCFALGLLVEEGRCVGIKAMGSDGQVNEVRSRHVLVATGGVGQLFVTGLRLQLADVLNPFKPWYVYRPSQSLRRLGYSIFPPGRDATIRLPWGAAIQVDGTKTIGRSRRHTGVYELATSELLWRLIRPGDRVLDIGANVGYMSALIGASCRVRGNCLCF